MTMKLNLRQLSAVFAAAMITIVTGCATTEVVDTPSGNEEKGEAVTLNIACPDAAKATRAGNDHALRFSAIMYEGGSIKDASVSQRKEKLASEEGSATITFEVPPGDYTFVVIGDYIPKVDADSDGVFENPDPDESGLYQDTYYDTKSEKEKIWSLAFKNKNVSKDFFNNDNYDCFASSITLTKEEAEINQDITLNRIVSRISLVSTTEAPAEIDNISIEHFDFFSAYLYGVKDTNQNHGNDSEYKIPKLTVESTFSEDNNELFYFYTLAPKAKAEPLYYMYVTVNFKDNSSRTTTILDKKIYPQSNYKVKVAGPFLSAAPVDKGPINLILTTDDSWAEDDIDVEVK